MSTTKLIDNNRRVHAAKVLAQTSKRNQVHDIHEEHINESTRETAVETEQNSLEILREQYDVIRDDVLKLREDLAQGYDLVLEYFKENANLRSLIWPK